MMKYITAWRPLFLEKIAPVHCSAGSDAIEYALQIAQKTQENFQHPQ